MKFYNTYHKAVQNEDIAPNAITTDKIQDDTILPQDIPDGGLPAAKAAAGFGRYVPRAVTAWDKNVGDFTTDGTLKADGLDFSAIIPAGAIAAVIRLSVIDDAVGSVFYLRKNATDIINTVYLETGIVNQRIENLCILNIDSDRLIDYWGSNLVWAAIDVAVLGWFI